MSNTQNRNDVVLIGGVVTFVVNLSIWAIVAGELVHYFWK